VDQRRYVVSRPFEDSNVGSNLANLAGAAWLARRLSRHLIVDWRGQRQLRESSLNYFAEFFATPSTIEGVPTLYAPVGDARYDEPSDDALWLSPGEAAALASSGEQPRAEYVVLQPYHGLDRLHSVSEGERFRLLRSFYLGLRPSPSIAAAVDKFAAESFGGAFVVAVNVRTGNGQYFGRGMRYAGRVDIAVFEDRRRFLRVLERACLARVKQLPRWLRDSFVVFYATDSKQMSDLLAGLPNAVTRRTIFPPPGTGDLYAFEEPGADRRSIEDTIADMFLLARSDALVYNDSLFNQYARVVTGWYGGNCVHLESLFLRTRARHLAAAGWRRIR
jgi:Nodulation protein Z (NodZ)